jgi:hypothetical protein
VYSAASPKCGMAPDCCSCSTAPAHQTAARNIAYVSAHTGLCCHVWILCMLPHSIKLQLSSMGSCPIAAKFSHGRSKSPQAVDSLRDIPSPQRLAHAATALTSMQHQLPKLTELPFAYRTTHKHNQYFTCCWSRPCCRGGLAVRTAIGSPCPPPPAHTAVNTAHAPNSLSITSTSSGSKLLLTTHKTTIHFYKATDMHAT